MGGTGTVFLAVLCVALLAPPADAATTNVIIDWNLAVNKVIRGAPAGNTTANANAFATFFEPAIGSQPAARVRIVIISRNHSPCLYAEGLRCWATRRSNKCPQTDGTRFR